MYLSSEQLLSLRRLKGEMNINTKELSTLIGIHRHTATKALTGHSLKPQTVNKINDWLLKQYLNN